MGRIFIHCIKEEVNLYMSPLSGFSVTLNLLCFIHFRRVQNEICDTVIAFTKFHSTVLDIIKVDDDIAIGLMGERERNYD